MAKMPKPPQVYLYPGAREIAPEIDSGSTVAILHAVEGRWRKRRFDVVWLGKESLPNYRYDRAVYPVRSQDWKALRGDDGQAVVSVRLGGRRWRLRLRGGHQFRRQLAAHAKMVDGLAVISELSLYEQRVNGGDHRPESGGRDSGGNRTASRLMCKMVAWLPREKQPDRAGMLFVMPSADGLIDAMNAKQNKLWSIHADHVWRWAAEHRNKLTNWSDDAKLEERGRPRSFAGRRERASLKYRRRMDTAVKQFAAQVVNYAKRCRFAAIEWISAPEKSGFEWAAFRERIAQLCDECGISFSVSKGGSTDGSNT